MGRKLRVFLIATYCLFIAYGSLSTPTDGPGLAINDKILHALLYAGLAGLALPLTQSTQTRVKILAAVILYGILMEIGQLFVPARQAEILDGVANSLGALAAMAVQSGLDRRRKRLL